MPDNRPITGQCLCGSIKLRIDKISRDVVYCHCSQCRRQSGHYYAATNVLNQHLHIDSEEHLRWYVASSIARRGFCGKCGSTLFWKANDSDTTSVMAGCLDSPTGLEGKAHIYLADKGDYYTIDDDLPQFMQSD